MIVTRNELVTYVDIDGTLCNKLPTQMDMSNVVYKADYYGTVHPIQPLWKNIDFVKTLKSRGWHIVINSHNGFQWAENVVRALGLEDYVDEVKTKSFKYIDDVPCEKWMGTRINLEEEK